MTIILKFRTQKNPEEFFMVYGTLTLYTKIFAICRKSFNLIINLKNYFLYLTFISHGLWFSLYTSSCSCTAQRFV